MPALGCGKFHFAQWGKQAGLKRGDAFVRSRRRLRAALDFILGPLGVRRV